MMIYKLDVFKLYAKDKKRLLVIDLACKPNCELDDLIYLAPQSGEAIKQDASVSSRQSIFIHDIR